MRNEPTLDRRIRPCGRDACRTGAARQIGSFRCNRYAGTQPGLEDVVGYALALARTRFLVEPEVNAAVHARIVDVGGDLRKPFVLEAQAREGGVRHYDASRQFTV